MLFFARGLVDWAAAGFGARDRLRRLGRGQNWRESLLQFLSDPVAIVERVQSSARTGFGGAEGKKSNFYPHFPAVGPSRQQGSRPFAPGATANICRFVPGSGIAKWLRKSLCAAKTQTHYWDKTSIPGSGAAGDYSGDSHR